jgi:hypothetical protein
MKRVGDRAFLGAFLLGIALAITSCGKNDPGGNPLVPFGSPFTYGTVVRTLVPGYRAGRPVFVYLPPGYSRSSRTYPTLVVLDGGSAFGGTNTFGIDRVVDSLLSVGTIGPTIVIGVGSAPGAQRFTEYIPDEGGEVYLEGLRDTLLPAMRRRYRCTSDPDSTYLMGASLGGLMSAYAGFAHDETFRRVAGLSVSYAYQPLLSTMRTEGRGALARFYQDTGDFNDNSFGRLQEVERLAVDSLGFVPDCSIKTVQAHGQHDIDSWSHRMPQVLEYLLGPPGAGCSSTAQLSP